ncbi:MAG: hypothetical protein ACOYL6_02675 [Bacteriovoracaceae bacterium]
MKKLSIIPVLVLSTACIKAKKTKSFPTSYSSSQIQKENSFRISSPSTLKASFSYQKQSLSWINLKSMSNNELSKMSLKIAERAFRGGDFALAKIIALGIPVMGLSKEDSLNLEQQMISLLHPDYEWAKDTGELEIEIESEQNSIDLEFYLIDARNHFSQKLSIVKTQIENNKKTNLKIMGLDSKNILQTLTNEGFIVAMPKGIFTQYNLIISDGQQLRTFQTRRENDLATKLKMLDPNSIVHGMNMVEKLYDQFVDSKSKWVLKENGDEQFLFYINSDFKNPSLLKTENNILLDFNIKKLNVDYALKAKDKLSLEFTQMSRVVMDYKSYLFYADQLSTDKFEYNCTATYSFPVGWKNDPVNTTDDLNFAIFFRERKINLKPLKIYKYNLGIKTQEVAKLIIELPINEEMENSPFDLEFRLGDLNAKYINEYTGCLVEKHPQYVPKQQTFLNYSQSRFNLQLSID